MTIGYTGSSRFNRYLFIAPAFLMVLIFMLVPMVTTVYISLTEYSLIEGPDFVGLANYLKLFRDVYFLGSLLNTLLWLVVTIVFPMGIGLLIAVSINRIPLEDLYKTIFYIPMTISGVATGVIWSFMYGPELGVVNTILRSIGWDGLARSWLTEVPLNTGAMMVAWTWRMTGRNMILFLIGLQAIPESPIEAIKIDGASSVQAFFHLILPMLRPVFTVVLTMSVINSLNQFDIIYVLTGGGPYRSSETLAVMMYQESFRFFHLGYGAAISIVISILTMGLAGVYLFRSIANESGVYG